MGQALYRKYRSQSLSEIVGQEHITSALQHALEAGRLSHAYLFTGPRGTGKTSIARILAYAVNGLEYSTEPQLDIIEIDAASNRRIDEIRDLRDKVYIAPSSAKYKVYIIDEVHMLTREAFNALLKTLEEPPAHVIFILATTDAHKLPETIVSRTQRYSFRPVPLPQVVMHLTDIANKEGININKDALELIAEHGGGSFRDSISMLDQVSNRAGTIDAATVQQQLGIPPRSAVADLLASIQAGDLAAPARALQGLYDQGFRAAAIASQLGDLLRSGLANGDLQLSALASLELSKKLLDVASAHNPDRYLELTLLEATLPHASVSTSALQGAAKTPKKSPLSAKKPGPESKQKLGPAPTNAYPAGPTAAVVTPEAVQASSAGTSHDTILDEVIWPDVLSALKQQYNTLYGIVRMAHVDFSEPGKLTLSFAFAFHQKRINDPKNRKLVTDTIAQVTGQPVSIICVVSTDPQQRPTVGLLTAQEPAAEANLQDINQIFGGGELI